MPYPSNAELPAGVRRHLPAHAQDIYREVFNHAWTAHADDARQEEIAHRSAWATVGHRYHKDADGMWRPNASGPRMTAGTLMAVLALGRPNAAVLQVTAHLA